MSEELNAIKKKITALLAKANGTDNEHEAEVFLSKANEWLERYQLKAYELNVEDPMGHQKGTAKADSMQGWTHTLGHYVAKYFGARIVWGPLGTGSRPYTIFGPESARITTELMLPYIYTQVRAQGRKFAADRNKSYTDKYGLNVFIRERAFKDGIRPMSDSVGFRHVGMALADRISEMVKAAESHREDLVARALVPVDTTQELIKAVIGETAPLGKKAPHFVSARGYADNISLSRQVHGTETKRIG